MLVAGGDNSEAARDALSRLCEIYWYPLYAYVRRYGANPDDARDLTQGFLLSLLERREIENVRQERGRFRAFFGFMTRYSEMFTLLEALHRPTPPPGSRLVNPEIRVAYEKYLVGRYGETLRDDRFWSSPIMKNLADRRRTAQEILVQYPSISGEELASATAIVEAERARAGRIGIRERIRGVSRSQLSALSVCSLWHSL